jgi:MFS family permease
MTGVGLFIAWQVHAHPERLHAPAWVAFAACLCFVVGGLAVALHADLSRRAFAWVMAGLLAIMASIPGWIAFGPGERQCVSSVGPLTSNFGCRFAFGVGAVVTAAMAALAVVLACRADTSREEPGHEP